MLWALYYLVMGVASAGARVAAFFNPKAKLFIAGRKGWKARLRSLPAKKGQRIWFHVSSLGEFEQARPVMERLKMERSEIDIILSFFSPSGYEIRKEYEHAHVLYLPLDLPGNAKHWISTIHPDMAVFVKYDLWPGYLMALVQKDIPFILMSAHLTPGRLFSSWSFPMTKALLKSSRMIFLQNGDHLDYVRKHGFENVMVAGDTRVDRVAALPAETSARLPAFLKNIKPFDIVCGSTWQEDERVLLPVLATMKLRAIIAPHDVSPANINRLCGLLPGSHIRLSSVLSVVSSTVVSDNQHDSHHPDKHLVIDSIGLLSTLYACGRIAYIGGGFGKGIHNILEPMSHGVPVIFGPRFQAFPEAVTMVHQSGAFAVRDMTELEGVLTRLRSGENDKAGAIASGYISRHKGATEIITRYLLESIPFAPQS